MCEFCEKIETTKNGLKINLDIAKGIYDNHKTCRYCVCKQDRFVIYLAQDIDEAEKVFGTYRNYLDVEIVDLEAYVSKKELRVKRMSDILRDFDKKNEFPKVKIPKFATGGICNDAIFPKLDAFSQIDEIVKDIKDRQDNAMAMEFTKCIGELLKKNGVVPKITEYTREHVKEHSIEQLYGVSIDELDFSEHDKAFEDKIAELKKDYKTASELLGKYQQENESLKKRVVELENFSCQAEQETESLVEKLKQRIAELESKETKSFDEVPDDITIDGYKCKIIKTESGLYISRDEIYSIIDKEKEPLKQKCKELDNRHQSDCIEINRLNTTIDVLIHKVEYLSQFAGLE